ncbi:MAG: VOC family protein [Cyanobacteria bacterium P01_H01_bin.15]
MTRPCLLVQDLKRSLSLYENVLGFRCDYQASASPDSYLYEVFQLPPQAQLTFATLSTDREARAIALTEVKGIELAKPKPPVRIGLVMEVEDLAATTQQVAAISLKVIPPHSLNSGPGRNFTEQGIYDFDGNLIVLYEISITSSED